MKSSHCWTLLAHKTVKKAVEWYLMFCLLPFSRANFPKGKVSRGILATYQICTINYSQTRAYCTTSSSLDHCTLFSLPG